MSDLAQALLIAIRVHATQVDKQGEPYLLHVLRVVESVQRSAQVVAALHDVIEDGGEEGRRLVAVLGLEDHERQALALLTRAPAVETYRNYIACLAYGEGIGGDIAREIKIADLRDHLGRIPREWEPLKRRYERALAVLEGAEA